jgi:hypothetical protein
MDFNYAKRHLQWLSKARAAESIFWWHSTIEDWRIEL